MPPVGFEPTISAGERPQTYALDRAATGTGTGSIYVTVTQQRKGISHKQTKNLYITILRSPRPAQSLRFHKIWSLDCMYVLFVLVAEVPRLKWQSRMSVDLLIESTTIQPSTISKFVTVFFIQYKPKISETHLYIFTSTDTLFGTEKTLMHTSTRLTLQIRLQKPNIDISEQIYSRDSQLKNLSGRLHCCGSWSVPWRINETTIVKCTKCKTTFRAKQKLLVAPLVHYVFLIKWEVGRIKGKRWELLL